MPRIRAPRVAEPWDRPQAKGERRRQGWGQGTQRCLLVIARGLHSFLNPGPLPSPGVEGGPY